MQLQLWLYSTWSVVDVGHGATFGGDVAQVDLLGLDLDLWAGAHVSMHVPEKHDNDRLHKCLGEMEDG